MGSQSTNNDVAGFTLVVLHRNPWDALRGIADVVVRKTSDLVRRHHIGRIDVALLAVQGSCLTLQVGSCDLNFTELGNSRLCFKAHILASAGSIYRNLYGCIACVLKLNLVLVGRQTGERESPVEVSGRSSAAIKGNDCTRQSNIGLVGCLTTYAGLGHSGQTKKGKK